jgi:hypothetical protein
MEEMGMISADWILKGIQAIQDDAKLVGEHRQMLPNVVVRESTLPLK